MEEWSRSKRRGEDKEMVEMEKDENNTRKRKKQQEEEEKQKEEMKERME